VGWERQGHGRAYPVCSGDRNCRKALFPHLKGADVLAVSPALVEVSEELNEGRVHLAGHLRLVLPKDRGLEDVDLVHELVADVLDEGDDEADRHVLVALQKLLELHERLERQAES
jgi:hypothetical protein